MGRRDTYYMITADTIYYTIKKTLSVVRPWKVGHPMSDYDKGWNDCLKEFDKNRTKYLKNLDKLIKDTEKEARGENLKNKLK